MRDIFASLDAYANSDFYRDLPEQAPKRSDRVLKSPRIDDEIYREVREPVNDVLSSIEERSKDTLPIMNSLTRDVFQCFYSLNPRCRPGEALTPFARKISRHILKDVTDSTSTRVYSPDLATKIYG